MGKKGIMFKNTDKFDQSVYLVVNNQCSDQSEAYNVLNYSFKHRLKKVIHFAFNTPG